MARTTSDSNGGYFISGHRFIASHTFLVIGAGMAVAVFMFSYSFVQDLDTSTQYIPSYVYPLVLAASVLLWADGTRRNAFARRISQRKAEVSVHPEGRNIKSQRRVDRFLHQLTEDDHEVRVIWSQQWKVPAIMTGFLVALILAALFSLTKFPLVYRWTTEEDNGRFIKRRNGTFRYKADTVIEHHSFPVWLLVASIVAVALLLIAVIWIRFYCTVLLASNATLIPKLFIPPVWLPYWPINNATFRLQKIDAVKIKQIPWVTAHLDSAVLVMATQLSNEEEKELANVANMPAADVLRDLLQKSIREEAERVQSGTHELEAKLDQTLIVQTATLEELRGLRRDMPRIVKWVASAGKPEDTRDDLPPRS